MDMRVSLRVAAAAVALVLVGGFAFSSDQAAPVGDANAARWGAEKIFEFDGCSVYRFNPGALAHWVYFTKCKNSSSSEASWTNSNGKATYPQMVSTGYVDN